MMILESFTLSNPLTAPSCHLHRDEERSSPGSVTDSHSLDVLKTWGLTPGFTFTYLDHNMQVGSIALL